MTSASASSDLRYRSIRDLSRLLRERKISAVELAAAVLDDLDNIGRTYRAVAELTPDRALAAARSADLRRRAGEDGPLLGIPYGAKDVIATAGIHTRWGSPTHADQVPSVDAAVITQLDASGAVLVAKLSTIELAGAGGYRSTAASIDGATRNPWDSRYWTGGSSSGPGAVVAAGLVPLALGTDTGGSIVIPAAFCGIVGLRPSHGLISTAGVMSIATSMDTVGPVARDVDDLTIALAQLSASFAADDHLWSDQPIVGVLTERLADSTATEVFRRALRTLEQTGAQLIQADLPSFNYLQIHRSVMAGEFSLQHRDFLESGRVHELLDPSQVEGLLSFAAQPRSIYRQAVVERQRASRALLRLFDHMDVLVAPTVTREALRLNDNVRSYHSCWPLPPLTSVGGFPALTVPIGVGSAGLPLALSLVGPPHTEGKLLHLASRIHEINNLGQLGPRRP